MPRVRYAHLRGAAGGARSSSEYPVGRVSPASSRGFATGASLSRVMSPGTGGSLRALEPRDGVDGLSEVTGIPLYPDGGKTLGVRGRQSRAGARERVEDVPTVKG